MQRMLLGILVSSLVAGSAPQLAEAAGHGHARKTNNAPAHNCDDPNFAGRVWEKRAFFLDC